MLTKCDNRLRAVNSNQMRLNALFVNRMIFPTYGIASFFAGKSKIWSMLKNHALSDIRIFLYQKLNFVDAMGFEPI